ncbi:DUF7537 family lipoprotein [Haloquadratum walsbyi]|jgi:hypothetical protein|uniref:DUF7537 family lipoprotein n=1 Tax=Haloquadratum walsbyi TaxID=293091 RepID=UPI0015F4A944|nr:hypothetical protein [Haloquadratum walsbyi]
MARTPIIVAGVVFLLIIAGCSAPTAPGPDDSTFESLPQSGLNATEIADAHITGLSAAESYIIQTEQRTVTETTNVSVIQQTESTRRIDLRANQELLVATTTQQQEAQSQSQSQPQSRSVQSTDQYYNNNGTIYVNQTQSNQSQYAIQQGQQATVNTTAQRSLIERLINTIEYRRVEQTQRGDTAVIRYELQSVTDVQNLTQTSTATVENATSTLVIDENGVIRELQLNAQFRTDRRTLRIRFATNYTQLGETTVSEPNWTDDAREASKTT